jgi:WD40 repeat protein
VGSLDNTLRLYDLNSKKALNEFSFDKEVTALSYYKDGSGDKILFFVNVKFLVECM